MARETGQLKRGLSFGRKRASPAALMFVALDALLSELTAGCDEPPQLTTTIAATDVPTGLRFKHDAMQQPYHPSAVVEYGQGH
jgi:hypothetical protein